MKTMTQPKWSQAASALATPECQALAQRLRAVVLLAGSMRPTDLVAAIGRSVLELPLSTGHTILAHWHEQTAALADAVTSPGLPVRVLINRGGLLPTPPADWNHVSMTIERDLSVYRGTAGVLRDVAEAYTDDAWLLVANGCQVLLEPLTELAVALAHVPGDVALVAHDDGTPSGLMLVRCGALRAIPAVGFVDMKEQALPVLARRHRVLVVHRPAATGLSVRTLYDYVRALQRRYDRAAPSEGGGAFGERWQDGFALVEPGAQVEAGAHLHDSVVLAGGQVGRDAVVVRSVVCAGGVVAPQRSIVEQLVRGRHDGRRRGGQRW